MKKILAILAFVGLIAPSVMAGGGIGAFGSYWKPKDEDDGKFGGGGKLNIGLTEYLAIDLRGSYYHYDNADIIPGEAGLVITIPINDVFMPYVGGGAGYYYVNITDDAMKEDVKAKAKVGFYGVGGIELGLGDSVALFGEAMYRFAKVDLEDKASGETVEEKLDGLVGNVGIKFKW
ncbi:MAG: outer membrane beta-barrel protein [Lentisphaerota bacterium]